MLKTEDAIKIAVVIPCYKVSNHILHVLAAIGQEIDKIYVVDDFCPEGSGKLVGEMCRDSRVMIIFNGQNLGVGGAVIAGYKQAMIDEIDIVVKIDGDDQMDLSIINKFIQPIINKQADYVKGNRFYNIEYLVGMPFIRLIGNAVLSFMNKLSSGYWNLFDPTNGYTAISMKIASELSLDKISARYFFESDMLFRLNLVRAVVVDIPMRARYGGEISNLHITKIWPYFLKGHFKNFCKRIFYNYYLRDVSIASIELPLGIFFLTYGIIYGAYNWFLYSSAGLSTPAGTIMLSSVSVLVGIQFILAFINYDINTVPKRVIY